MIIQKLTTSVVWKASIQGPHGPAGAQKHLLIPAQMHHAEERTASKALCDAQLHGTTNAKIETRV